MANIDLSNKKNYKVDFIAYEEIEDKLGIPYSKLDLETMTTKQAIVIVWGALYHIDNSLTVDDIRKMINKSEIKLEIIMKHAAEAFVEYISKNYGE